MVTGGCDPVHPTEAAERIHRLLPNARYHDPVMTRAEWDSVFNVVPYPEVSDLQGARIAPVWRSFIAQTESDRRQRPAVASSAPSAETAGG